MRVAVIGGGLAGLCAARALADGGARVCLVEADRRLGGQIRTTVSRGFVVEHGAEGFTPSSERTLALCRRLGLEPRIVAQERHQSLVLGESGLLPLPAGAAARLLGIQAAAGELGRGLLTFRRGLGELTGALARSLGDGIEWRTGVATRRLRPQGGRWRLELEDGTRRRVDAVALALPAAASAALVGSFAPHAGAALAALPTASSIVVTLALPVSAVGHPLDASGLVAGPDRTDLEGLRACTFVSSKFPGRAPPGWCLLRAFYRPTPDELAEPDDAWVARAERTLGPVLALHARASWHRVSRWPSARAQYGPGYADRVAECEAELRRHGPIELAGSAYRASGVEAAVATGAEAAERLLRTAGVAAARARQGTA